MDDHHHFGCIKNSFKNNIESNPIQPNTTLGLMMPSPPSSPAKLWVSFGFPMKLERWQQNNKREREREREKGRLL
jgi:hypothetical protein